MVSELKILNLAFVPLSDESADEGVDIGDEDLDGDGEKEKSGAVTDDEDEEEGGEL